MTTTPRFTRVAGAVLTGGLLIASLAACGGSSRNTSTAASQNQNQYKAGEPAAPGTASGNTFDDAGVNPFTTTTNDALSTFGLDVDTGSYTVGRQMLKQGSRPVPASVRVEEYVNFFEQDYPAPIGDDFGITVDGGSTPFLTDPSHQLVRVGIAARDNTSAARKDVALTFLIDTSGSMQDSNRLPLVKQSFKLLLDNLAPTDTVAIVEFGSEARVVADPTPVSQKRELAEKIDRLGDSGSTNAEAGLLLAYQLADIAYKPGAVNRVVLASDGGANVGVVDGTQLATEIGAHADKGIQLATFGFGMGDYNDALMEQLANKGDGFYAYVDSIDEAKRLFSERLSSTLDTVALDAKAQVAFDPNTVTRYRLVGYENRDVADLMFRADPNVAGLAAKGGQINAGHRVTALYEVELTPFAQSLPGAQLGTVTLRWQNPDSRASVEITQPVATDHFTAWDSAPARFKLDAVVAQYAELLRKSAWVRGSLNDVLTQAKALPEDVRRDPDVAELIQLIGQSTQLPDNAVPARGDG